MELFQLTQGTQGARKNSALYGSSNNSSYTETATDENGFSYKDLLEQFQDQRNLGKKNQDQAPVKSNQPTPIKETSAEEMLGNLSRMLESFNVASNTNSNAVLGKGAGNANNAETAGLSYSRKDMQTVGYAIMGWDISDKELFEKLDINNDGKINKYDLNSIKNMLDSDQDGDGVFDQSDVKAILHNKVNDEISFNAVLRYREKQRCQMPEPVIQPIPPIIGRREVTTKDFQAEIAMYTKRLKNEKLMGNAVNEQEANYVISVARDVLKRMESNIRFQPNTIDKLEIYNTLKSLMPESLIPEDLVPQLTNKSTDLSFSIEEFKSLMPNNIWKNFEKIRGLTSLKDSVVNADFDKNGIFDQWDAARLQAGLEGRMSLPNGVSSEDARTMLKIWKEQVEKFENSKNQPIITPTPQPKQRKFLKI